MSDKDTSRLFKCDKDCGACQEQNKPLNEKESYLIKKADQSRKICDSLIVPTDDYEPENTVEAIKLLINDEINNKRILYSEISNFLFDLDDKRQSNFSFNIQVLLQAAVFDEAVEGNINNKTNISDDCKKVIFKLYDHFHLVSYQINNFNRIAGDLTSDIKNEIKIDVVNDVKRTVEKEYVAILGIFAAIVLAFVGGMVFSTSALKYINAVSIYRLLLVLDCIALVFLCVISFLVDLVFKINDRDTKEIFTKITRIIIVCGVFAFLILVAWLIDAKKLAGILYPILPWN